MIPVKKGEQTILECKACGKTKPFDDEMQESYDFTVEIEHPKGSEMKSATELKKHNIKLKM